MPEPKEAPPHGIIADGSILSVDGHAVLPNVTWGQWFGDIAAVIPESNTEDLYLEWTGSILPPTLFREILGFFKWSFDEYACESQLRLYYRKSDKQWKAVVMPQFIISGASSTENDKDPNFEVMKAALAKDGFGHVGSAHHHCTMSAFQSSTDYKDEIETEGFHYTIGDLDTTEASFHGRCVVRKICYEPDILGFVPYVDNGVLAIKNLPEPPKEWKDQMTKKVVAPVRYGTFGMVASKKFGFSTWSPGNRSTYNPNQAYGSFPPSPANSYNPSSAQAARWQKEDEDSEYDYNDYMDSLEDTELGPEIVLGLMESAMDVWGLSKLAREQFDEVITALDWSVTLSTIDPSVFQALADYASDYREALIDFYMQSEKKEGA